MYSFVAQTSRILNSVALAIAATTWHTFYIVRGVPKYQYLGDNLRTLFTFVGLAYGFFVLGRLDKYPNLQDLFDVGTFLIWMLFWGVMTMRKHRSDSLFVAIVVADSFWDLVRSFVAIEKSMLIYFGITALKLLVIARCAVMFLKQPEEVQASGYKRYPRVEEDR